MRRPILLGAALSAALIPVHVFAPPAHAPRIAAASLAVIAGAYLGFAAVDGRAGALATEFVGALLFGAAAVAGLVWSPFAIPAGLFAHALWDIAHHEPTGGRIGAKTPRWYPPFCVVVDVALGAALLALYLGWF